MKNKFVSVLFLLVFGLSFISAAITAEVNINNGEVTSLEISADQAKITAQTNLGLDNCTDCEVELTETKVDGEVRASYKVTSNQKVKFLWLFKTNSKIETNIDAETGAVISVKKPWWSFLSSEVKIKEENEESKEDNVKAEAETEAKVNIQTTKTNSLSDWCVKGQTYSVEQEGSTSDTIIEGTASYKGSQWCKGTSKTVIQIPYGGGTMEVETVYYFNEGATEMWVVSNAGGQTTEIHVNNN